MTARLALLALAAAFACVVLPAAAQAQTQTQQQIATEAGIDAAFKAWDGNHDGFLSQAEFRAGMGAAQHRARERAALAARLREQFEKVDANHDGGIDAGEYANLMLVHDAGKAAPALSSFDRNGDQRLEFAEYLALVGRLAPAHRVASPSSTPSRTGTSP
jgi:Ca2+-binding EF-hand superfamily protein